MSSSESNGQSATSALRKLNRPWLGALWDEVDRDKSCKLCKKKNNLGWAPFGFFVRKRSEIVDYKLFRKNLKNWGFVEGVSPRATPAEMKKLSRFKYDECYYQQDDLFTEGDAANGFAGLCAMEYLAQRKKTAGGKNDATSQREERDSEGEKESHVGSPTTNAALDDSGDNNNGSHTKTSSAPIGTPIEKGKGEQNVSSSRKSEAPERNLSPLPVDQNVDTCELAQTIQTILSRKKQPGSADEQPNSGRCGMDCTSLHNKKRRTDDDALDSSSQKCKPRVSDDAILQCPAEGDPRTNVHAENFHCRPCAHDSTSLPSLLPQAAERLEQEDKAPHDPSLHVPPYPDEHLRSIVNSLCDDHLRRRSCLKFQVNNDSTMRTTDHAKFANSQDDDDLMRQIEAYRDFADQLRLLMKISYLWSCEGGKTRQQFQKFEWGLPSSIDCKNQKLRDEYFRKKLDLEATLQALLDANLHEQINFGERMSANSAAIALASQLQLLQQIAFRRLRVERFMAKEGATLSGTTKEKIDLPEPMKAASDVSCKSKEDADLMEWDAVSRRSLAPSKTSRLHHGTIPFPNTPRLFGVIHVCSDVFVWMDGIRVNSASLRCDSFKKAKETLRAWQTFDDYGSEASLGQLRLVMSSAAHACSFLSDAAARIAARGFEIIANYYHIGMSSGDLVQGKRKAQDLLRKTVNNEAGLRKLSKKSKRRYMAPLAFHRRKTLLNAFRKLSYMVHTLEPRSENYAHPIFPELVSAVERHCKQYVYIETHFVNDHAVVTESGTSSQSSPNSRKCDGRDCATANGDKVRRLSQQDEPLSLRKEEEAASLHEEDAGPLPLQETKEAGSMLSETFTTSQKVKQMAAHRQGWRLLLGGNKLRDDKKIAACNIDSKSVSFLDPGSDGCPPEFVPTVVAIGDGWVSDVGSDFTSRT